MKTYRCNCILTFGKGQRFLDLYVPLEAGAEACRALFLAVAEALEPTLTSTLDIAGTDLPKPNLPVFGWEFERRKLHKVSMAVTDGLMGANRNGDADLPAWYREAQGKLYFNT